MATVAAGSFRTAALPRLASSVVAAASVASSSSSSSPLIPSRPLRTASIFMRQLAALPFLPAISLSLPSLLEGIWESILRAVPKKKTSHMKKRHRQMAGKALKDVNSLCKCPACGRTKRMHYMCPYCLESLQQMMKKKL